MAEDAKTVDAGTLTAKQRLFAEHYVVLLNATRAAIAAGYSVNGAGVTAHHLLRNTNVKRYIDQLFEAGKMSKHEVIGQLAALSRADIGDYLKVVNVLRNGVEVEEWRFDLVKAIKDGNTSLIRSIKRDKFGVVVELFDRVRTLELIGRHHRLFADVTLTSDKPDGTADVLDDATLAEIAAKQGDQRDIVDEFDAEDKASNVYNVIVPEDEIGENSRGEDAE